MSTRPSHRTAAPSAAAGSLTVTSQEAGPSTAFSLPARTLRLRAEPAERRRIQWAEDVIDNEGMGKKSSKVCCIYHKPRGAGESSSDESSSSSDSDDDSEPDTSRAQPANRRPRSNHHHHHDDAEPCEQNHGPEDAAQSSRKREKARRRSPNAYERVPKRKSQKGKEPE
ncbi:hypothetical protein MBLNU459_g7102t1 [Dothideomycetes sp. NU459]